MSGPAPEPQSMACAVCGLILHRLVKTTTDTVGTTESWIHNEPADHVTVPVSVADIRANFRCDFCMADHARWTLPVEQYLVAPGNMNDGDWAACDDCAALLRIQNWEGVTVRAHRIFSQARPGVPVQAFQLMYRQLRDHIVGPVRLNIPTRYGH